MGYSHTQQRARLRRGASNGKGQRHNFLRIAAFIQGKYSLTCWRGLANHA